MSWAKLDDGFWMHPKVLIAGNTAAGVFARMLSYCGCYLTDGLVPVEIAQTIVGSDKKALAALERAGLVDVQEHGSVWICDYLDYNRDSHSIRLERERRAESGRRGGQKSRPPGVAA